jgi:hypothetical protein
MTLGTAFTSVGLPGSAVASRTTTVSPRRVTGEQLVGDGEESALRLRNGAQEGGASGVVGEVGGVVARGRAAAVVGAGEGVCLVAAREAERERERLAGVKGLESALQRVSVEELLERLGARRGADWPVRVEVLVKAERHDGRDRRASLLV